MGMFDDKEAVPTVAADLQSYLNGHPAINVTMRIRNSKIELEPATGETFEITCVGPNDFRLKSMGSGFRNPAQVQSAPPAWSDNQRFDESGMVAKVKEWLHHQH